MAEQAAASAPDSAPGLRQIEFELGDSSALEALERTLADARADAAAGADAPAPIEREADDELAVRDPDGQLLTFTRRSP